MTEESRGQPSMSPVASVLADSHATSSWQEHLYKKLHANPELCFQGTKTAALAASKLKKFGYEVSEGIGRTGVVGVLRNGDGQTVLPRADMAALPVKENTGLPYASTMTAIDEAGETVNVAHACGHDAHVTCWARRNCSARLGSRGEAHSSPCSNQRKKSQVGQRQCWLVC